MRKVETILPALVFATTLGCGDDIVPFPQGQFGNDTGIMDTGFVEYDLGAGIIEPGECITNGVSGAGGTALGYRYQCQGIFGATFTYTYNQLDYNLLIPDIVNDPNGDSILFGYGGNDTYWAPKVMACCGEYDSSMDFLDQPEFALNCIMDAREQACYSAIHALQKEHNSLPSGGRKTAVGEILDHVHTNQGLTDCIAGLGVNFGGIQNVHGATWDIDHAWTSASLDSAKLQYGVIIGGVTWPEYDSPSLLETCDSLDDNNLVVFDNVEPPLTYQVNVTLEEADGDLDGPAYGGATNYVVSTAGFASDFNTCVDPRCSFADLSEDAYGNWQIDEMVLFVDGYIVIDNGVMSATLDRGYVELSGPAKGSWTTRDGTTSYTIPAGDASFVVGGSAGEDNAFVTAYNTTAISASYSSSGEWSFSTFDIEYVDSVYGVFTLTVDASNWLEN